MEEVFQFHSPNPNQTEELAKKKDKKISIIHFSYGRTNYESWIVVHIEQEKRMLIDQINAFGRGIKNSFLYLGDELAPREKQH